MPYLKTLSNKYQVSDDELLALYLENDTDGFEEIGLNEEEIAELTEELECDDDISLLT